MNLKSLYSSKKTPISFEIFPPKNDESGEKLEKLISHLCILKEKNPAFISLTYGAGGSGQNYSFEIIKRIQNEINIPIMPHFTCVSLDNDSVINYLDSVKSFGIKNILALRGDIPNEINKESLVFKYASDLVEIIKKETNLSIAVAGYPEGHIECESFEQDLINLKRKVEKGADAIFTQMFFDNNKYFDFVERAENIGINIPIIPGILPVKSFAQLEKMLSMAQIFIPKVFLNKLEKYKDNKDAIQEIGLEFASKQCENLLSNNVKGLHFYTLNTSSTVVKIIENIEYLF